MSNVTIVTAPSLGFTYETLVEDQFIFVPIRRQYLVQGELWLDDSSEIVLDGSLALV